MPSTSVPRPAHRSGPCSGASPRSLGRPTTHCGPMSYRPDSSSAAGPASRGHIPAELHGQASRDDAAPQATVGRAAITGIIGFAAVGICYVAQRGGGIEPWQSPAGSVAPLVAVLMLFATAGMLVP